MRALFTLLLFSFALFLSVSAQTCFAPNTSNKCTQCPDGQVTEGQCIPFYYSHCYNSMAECQAAFPSVTCYAKNGWGADAVCVLCDDSTSAGECPAFGFTKCSATYEACSGGAPNPNPSNPTTTTTTKATTTTTKAKTTTTTKYNPGVVTTTTTTKRTTTTTPSNNPNPVPSPSYDTCASCPANTLGLKRPTFRGPNCYAKTARYPQFGPQWAPSGKTAFEKLIPSPSHMHKFAQWGQWGEQPIMKSMGSGCNAAALLWENFVCAIEMLQVNGKAFPRVSMNAPAYTVDDFLNSGDSQKDMLELAAFIAHNWKETAVYGTFEEATNGAYTSESATYPAVAGKSYHGRGLIQLSYNVNYGMFSEFIFGNKNALLYSPEDLDPEGPMGVMAGIWFWMAPHTFTGLYLGGSGGSMAPRDAVIHATDGQLGSLYGKPAWNNVAGFGLSTNVINGGIECNGQSVTPSHAARVGYFLTAMSRLGMSLPNYKDPAACKADAFCYSLFRGCGSQPNVPTGFTEQTGKCGVSITGV